MSSGSIQPHCASCRCVRTVKAEGEVQSHLTIDQLAYVRSEKHHWPQDTLIFVRALVHKVA
eukprot:3485141-Amphidinium_carterae.1